MLNKQQFKSQLIALSAPSGAGKTTIVHYLMEKYPELVTSISATTRARRPGEVDGKDYLFISRELFEQKIKNNAFLEFEEVHGNLYGTLKESVLAFIDVGKTVLFDVDVNGALAIKSAFPESLLIFIKPPSRKELIRRLQERNSESDEKIQIRLKRLDFEYAQSEHFDFIVINDSLEDAIDKVERYILKNG